MGLASHKYKQAMKFGIKEEGLLREALAAYFLSVPPPTRQNPRQREQYGRALRRLAQLETLSVLQTSCIQRPLRCGDVNRLLYVTLEACSRRMEERGLVVEYHVDDKALCMAAEPRLIQMALVRLLGAAGQTAENGLYVRVKTHPNSLSVCVEGGGIRDTHAMALVHAAARLHKGSVALSGNRSAFSLRLGLPAACGFFDTPSAEDLLRDTLSPVNVGLA